MNYLFLFKKAKGKYFKWVTDDHLLKDENHIKKLVENIGNKISIINPSACLTTIKIMFLANEYNTLDTIGIDLVLIC